MVPHRRAHRSVEPISSRLGQASRGAARALRAVEHQTTDARGRKTVPPIFIEWTRTRAAPRRVLCIAVDSAPRRPTGTDFASTASWAMKAASFAQVNHQGDPGNDYGNRIRAAHRHRFARGESEGDVPQRRRGPAWRISLEMGRAMAERLGYAPADLDRIRRGDEYDASVGYYFHLAAIPGREKSSSTSAAAGGWTRSLPALKVGFARKSRRRRHDQHAAGEGGAAGRDLRRFS